MRRERRAVLLLALASLLQPFPLHAQSLDVLDVPFIAQSELLCGGAAAAMVMRYWGVRGVEAESFRSLVDAKSGGIRTDALTADLRARSWNALAFEGSFDVVARELRQGRPVITLIEDRPRVYHYVVLVALGGDGVVFHDPARTPFRVMRLAQFDKRWSAAHRWMLIVTPPSTPPIPPVTSPAEASTPCEAQIASAVQQARGNRLDEAERTLVGALSCPGAAVFRELAGVRAIQRRWADAAELASAALAREPDDAYAARLLGTARFIGNDQIAALDAWNRAGEPRVDLIRVDGLMRTRYRVVEQLLGIKTSQMLTRAALVRARRRLNELPSGGGTVDFVPQPAGLAEVRATVAERALVPRTAFDLGVAALATAIRRELVVRIASPTGGGEQVTADWRFWAHRPLYRLSVDAPAPWRGTWGVAASRERQPFTRAFSATIRDSVQLDVADWASGLLRWQVGAGLDRWNGDRLFGMAQASVRAVSARERLDARAQVRRWFGDGPAFHQVELAATARSSPRLSGVVVTADGGAGLASAAASADLWYGGDTGRARPLLLRAHPILTSEERFRTERIGRLFAHQSTEVQRWWRAGPFAPGIAAFVDTAITARRLTGGAITDMDVGIGFRGASPGRAGALRLDIARGIRDGHVAISAVYTADIP